MNVPVVETAGDHLVVDLGNVNASGRLEIDIPGSETLSFQLEQDDGWDNEPNSHDDPWSPE